MFVFGKIVIFEGSPHPGRPRHPWNCELAAGRASSRTTVPAGKKAPHVPDPLPLVMVQLMPAGCDVTTPLPLPPGMMLRLPVPTDGVQPCSVGPTVKVPSLTVIRQVGELKFATSMRNWPAPSAVLRTTPSIEMAAFGTAPWPSTRSWPLFSSARVTLSAASAVPGPDRPSSKPTARTYNIGRNRMPGPSPSAHRAPHRHAHSRLGS